ncbi:MAG: ComEA family DNA-binding protein [Firmicutes bacterium]|nr:ComEA family DNA-binding protein [Bacillota bacterium]
MIHLERRYRILLAGILGIVLFAGGIVYARHYLSPPPPLSVNPGPEAGTVVKVHVAGAVDRPGLYEFPAGSRVMDAVEKASPAPDADINRLNLAAVLNDGQKVQVPQKGEVTGPAVGDGSNQGDGNRNGTSVSANGLVNLNTASLAELDRLPGIGPTLAQRIIDYRQQKGGFRRIEDVKNVSGIGDKLFLQIKDLITVD